MLETLDYLGGLPRPERPRLDCSLVPSFSPASCALPDAILF
jgi:hypothetical protein